MVNIANISRRAFTLIELLAAITIMSIISVTLMPVIGSATEWYIVSRQVRSSTDRAGFAFDRITRVVLQAPIGANDSGVGILTAGVDSVEFIDGTGVRLLGTTLEMLVPGQSPVPLCFEVSSFTIEYLADDGLASTAHAPALTHRFVFTIMTENIEHSVLVHPRVWIGQVGSCVFSGSYRGGNHAGVR